MLTLSYAHDTGDLDVTGDGAEPDLTTEVLIALMTDTRAEPGELPEGVGNRGFWDDALEGEPLGSRLWLLEHAAATEANARRAEQYANEALGYLVRDKRARLVECTGEVSGPTLLLSVRVDGVELVRAMPVN